MSRAVLGLVHAEPSSELADALRDRADVVAVEPAVEAIRQATVQAWVVSAQGVDRKVLQVIRDGEVPAVFVVADTHAAAWLRVLGKGVHDVVWAPARPSEVRARALALVARQQAWSPVCDALCREIAHDLRGPLQALNFTVAALESDGAVAEGYGEDVDALLEAADVADLMLDGVANLGRRAVAAADDDAVDLVRVVREVAGRRAWASQVQVEAGEAVSVRVPAGPLRSAVADLIRVVWIRAAGGRQVRVQCLVFGDEAVLTAQARAYDALLEQASALLSRARPIILRRERVPMPIAGLAYAREVALSGGGDLAVRRAEQELVVEMRLPRV